MDDWKHACWLQSTALHTHNGVAICVVRILIDTKYALLFQIGVLFLSVQVNLILWDRLCVLFFSLLFSICHHSCSHTVNKLHFELSRLPVNRRLYRWLRLHFHQPASLPCLTWRLRVFVGRYMCLCYECMRLRAYHNRVTVNQQWFSWLLLCLRVKCLIGT